MKTDLKIAIDKWICIIQYQMLFTQDTFCVVMSFRSCNTMKYSILNFSLNKNLVCWTYEYMHITETMWNKILG